MKKILAIILTGALMLSLAACGDSSQGSSQESEATPSSNSAQGPSAEGPVAYEGVEISLSGIEDAYAVGQDFMLTVTIKNTGTASIFYAGGDSEPEVKEGLLLSDSVILQRNLGSAPQEMVPVEIPAGGEATLSLYLYFGGEPEFGDSKTLETSGIVTFFYAMEEEGLNPEAFGSINKASTEFSITIDKEVQ